MINYAPPRAVPEPRRILLGAMAFLFPLLLGGAASPALGAQPVVSEHGMVVSRSRLASEVGAAVLADGGNAVDAAVATGFALAVTYPAAGNLGGGGFMVIRLADGTVVANDHREQAPAGASRDMYLDEEGEVVPELSTHSHLAVGVPGTVDGLLDVLEAHGTFSRRDVLSGAIRLARGGFELNAETVRDFAEYLPHFARYPASRAVFSRDGAAYAVGDRFVQSDLAATLKRISREGRDGFYAGRTADLLVAEMQRGGGLITHEDLAAYDSRWREPIRGTYRGYEVLSMPPPSSGGILLVQMLNMLEPFDIGSLGYGSAAAVHLLVEAERRAYADRAEHLGDADYYPVPIARLTAKDYARARFADFDAGKAGVSAEISAGRWPQESPDTTHLSVVDAAGNAVAYTTTLNLSYGSKIVAAGTGVLLNNEMDDFAARPDAPNFYGLLGGEANAIVPGKRMLSSMTPTIVVRDGRPVLVTGSPGGSTIITTVLQVLVNTIDHGMPVEDAVGLPRFHHQWQPDRIVYEPYALLPDTRARLTALGHNTLAPLDWAIGDAHSIAIEYPQSGEGAAAAPRLHGMADPRHAGAAVGVAPLR